MKKLTKFPRSKTTIGLLLDGFTAQYHLDIWWGVSQAAQINDVNLYTFMAGRLQAPDQREVEFTNVFQLAHQGNIDGFVVLGTIGELLSLDERNQFVAQYHPLPAVAVAGFPNCNAQIFVDNFKGMTEGVEHLITFHGCQNLAFVSGPENNLDADQRLAAFQQTLQKHNLEFDKSQIYYGNFMYDGGYQVALEMLNRGLEYDGIVAADDSMAAGVLEALDKHGIKVPEQVAVIGFDDEEVSLIATPPITTIRQPTREIGFRAVERLLDEIAGKPNLPDEILMPTKMIIRHSCGCRFLKPTFKRAEEEPVAVDESLSIEKVMQNLDKDRGKIFQEMDVEISKSSMGYYDLNWLSQLFSAFQDSVRGGELKPLLTALEGVMVEMFRNKFNLLTILDSVAVLFRYLHQQGLLQIGQMSLDLSWQETYKFIDSISHRLLLNEKSISGQNEYRMRYLGLELVSQHELSGLFEILIAKLPQMNIEQFYLILYDEQSRQGFRQIPEWSRLVLAYNESGYMAPDFDRQYFQTKQILPSYLFPLQNQARMIIMSLYSYYEEFGYLIINLDTSTPSFNYDSLRIHLSIALQSILSKIRLLDHHKQLESEVTSKAFELALANEQLKTYMAKLERGNRRLRQFTHIASHEFQEPLRKIQVFCDRMMRLYGTQLDSKGQDYLERLQESSARLQHLVDDLLNFTQVTSQSRFQDIVDLNVILEEVKEHLNKEITAVNAQIESDELPAIEANASQMRQVFYNLLANSLKFCKDDTSPKITIQSQLLPGNAISEHYWQLTFADNGIGFDKKYAEKIFNMFQRLHSRQEYEGTGIGLAVCHRLVELHNGRIEVTSKPNEGTQFIVTLPASQS